MEDFSWEARKAAAIILTRNGTTSIPPVTKEKGSLVFANDRYALLNRLNQVDKFLEITHWRPASEYDSNAFSRFMTDCYHFLVRGTERESEKGEK